MASRATMITCTVPLVLTPLHAWGNRKASREVTKVVQGGNQLAVALYARMRRAKQYSGKNLHDLGARWPESLPVHPRQLA